MRKLTLTEALDAISRGETTEEYLRRKARIRRLSNERWDLVDAIEVLKECGDIDRAAKKQKRLEKVLAELDKLVNYTKQKGAKR